MGELPGQLDAMDLLARPAPDRSYIDCKACGYTHKNYMRHCACGRASNFINPETGLCTTCRRKNE